MTTRIKPGLTIVLLALLFTGINGCKKYLAKKSDESLAVASTLADLQSLLDNYGVVNGSSAAAASEISADDYYLTDADWQALYYEEDRRMYIWAKDHIFLTGDLGNDWEYFYSSVYYSNTVLEQLNKIDETPENADEYNNIKGQALMLRANRFMDIASGWTLAYDKASAATTPGIVLRTTTDFNKVSVRATLQETYDKIIADLKESAALLPVIPLKAPRASKPAAFALLARTYLWMGDYSNAGLYADSCLQLYHTLLDYNTIDASAGYPFQALNAEVIFDKGSALGEPLYNWTAKIDSFLIQSYDSNDLRKTLFFIDNGNGTYSFKGFYSGYMGLFTGVATDEVYLTRAECYAREGKVAEAMNDLNTLLTSRYKAGTFVPLSAASENEALGLILAERRKELLMRELRWMDIKRLNKEGAGITLVRKVNGKTYTLPPGDPRFALPIPEDVIAASGMQQNER
jgi:hypothetical protein